MRCCVIPKCPNSKKPTSGGFPVSVHIFPTGSKRSLQRQLWVETFSSVPEEELGISLDSKGICAAHFTPYDYSKTRLTETAIPSQNLPAEEEKLGKGSSTGPSQSVKKSPPVPKTHHSASHAKSKKRNNDDLNYDSCSSITSEEDNLAATGTTNGSKYFCGPKSKAKLLKIKWNVNSSKSNKKEKDERKRSPSASSNNEAEKAAYSKSNTTRKENRNADILERLGLPRNHDVQVNLTRRTCDLCGKFVNSNGNFLLHGRFCVKRFSGTFVPKSKKAKSKPVTCKVDDDLENLDDVSSTGSVTSQMTVPITTTVKKFRNGNKNNTEEVVIGYKVDVKNSDQDLTTNRISPFRAPSKKLPKASSPARKPSLMKKDCQANPKTASQTNVNVPPNDSNFNNCSKDKKSVSNVVSASVNISNAICSKSETSETKITLKKSKARSIYDKKIDSNIFPIKNRESASDVISKFKTISNAIFQKSSSQDTGDHSSSDLPSSDSEAEEFHIVEEIWNDVDDTQESRDEKRTTSTVDETKQESLQKVKVEPEETKESRPSSANSGIHEALLPPPKRCREIQGLMDDKGNFPVVLNSVRQRNPVLDKSPPVETEPPPAKRKRKKSKSTFKDGNNGSEDDEYKLPYHARDPVPKPLFSKTIPSSSSCAKSTFSSTTAHPHVVKPVKKPSLKKTLSKATNPLRNYKLALLAEKHRRSAILRKTTKTNARMVNNVRRDLQLSDDSESESAEPAPYINIIDTSLLLDDEDESSNGYTAVKVEEVMLEDPLALTPEDQMASSPYENHSESNDAHSSDDHQGRMTNLLSGEETHPSEENDSCHDVDDNYVGVEPEESNGIRISDNCLEPEESNEIRISNVCSIDTTTTENEESIYVPTSTASTKPKPPSVTPLRLPELRKAYKCEECTRCFKNSTSLKLHISICHKNELLARFECQVCGKKCFTQYQYTVHSKEHESQQNCENTNNSYAIANNSHNINNNSKFFPAPVRRKGTSRYSCNPCKKWFLDINFFYLHRSIFHINVKGQQVRSNECDICLTEFPDVFQLQQHVDEIRHRPENGKSYQCIVCRKCFEHRKSLRTHNRMHVNHRPYKCDVCPASFFKPRERNLHKQKHVENQLPHICTGCGMQFSVAHLLEAHIRTHVNGPTSMQDFCTCDMCDLHFVDVREYNSHHRLHHRGNRGAEVLICNKCGVSFPSALALEVHTMDHDKMNMIPCSLCYKSFKLQLNLDRHMENVHGVCSRDGAADAEDLPSGMVETVLDEGASCSWMGRNADEELENQLGNNEPVIMDVQGGQNIPSPVILDVQEAESENVSLPGIMDVENIASSTHDVLDTQGSVVNVPSPVIIDAENIQSPVILDVQGSANPEIINVQGNADFLNVDNDNETLGTMIDIADLPVDDENNYNMNESPETDPLADSPPSEENQESSDSSMFSILQVVSHKDISPENGDDDGIRKSSIGRHSVSFQKKKVIISNNRETRKIVRGTLTLGGKKVTSKSLYPSHSLTKRGLVNAHNHKAAAAARKRKIVPVVTLEDEDCSENNVSTGVKCTICQVVFPSQALLDVHVATDHYTFYKCTYPDCGGLFTSEEAKRTHEKIHSSSSNSNSTPGLVNQSAQMSAASSTSRSASNTAHTAPTSRLAAALSNPSSSSNRTAPTYTIHHRNVASEASGSAPAHTAPLRTYSSKASLPAAATPVVSAASLLSALPSRPPANCDICGFEPMTAQALHMHLKIHVRDDATKPYHCEQCPSYFETLEKLNSHDYEMHTMKQCNICERWFATSLELRNHVLFCIENFSAGREHVSVQIVDSGTVVELDPNTNLTF